MWFIGSGFHSELEHVVRCVVQSICIGAVNAFVLISGWFGIRGDVKKIGDLMFLLLFCTLPLLCVALVCGWLPLSALDSIEGIYEYVFGGNGYWFVVDYVGLLFFAPILNKGIESIGRKQYIRLLSGSFTLIAIYDFVFRTSVLGAEGGYSLIWFVFLYLFARYMRIYGLERIEKCKWQILILAVVLQSILFYYGLIGLRYTNPLIFLEAVCILLIFKNWTFRSNAINYAAPGSLMAYLLHMQPILIPYIRHYLSAEYLELGYWLYMGEVIVFSILVFLIAIPLNNLQATLFHKIRLCS